MEPTISQLPQDPTWRDPARIEAMPRRDRSAQVLAFAQTMDALCELARVERAALRLVYWGGLTQRQVAAQLDISESDVGRHVARGLRVVAAHLTATPVARSRPRAGHDT